MLEQPTVVRPPEFKKVLEELHVVRLSDNLKSEIQARRDLEEVYHRLLQDVAKLEETIKDGQASIESAKKDAEKAVSQRKAVSAENSSLQHRLTLAKAAILVVGVTAIALAALSWEELSALLGAYTAGQS